MSFLQSGCKAVCWLSAHSQQPPHTHDKCSHFDLGYEGEESRLLWIYLPLGAAVNFAFQALPGSSFSILLCLSSHARLLAGDLLSVSVLPLMDFEQFFLKTHCSPSFPPDSSSEALPVCPPAQIPAARHGSPFPLLLDSGAFIQDIQRISNHV